MWKIKPIRYHIRNEHKKMFEQSSWKIRSQLKQKLLLLTKQLNKQRYDYCYILTKWYYYWTVHFNKTIISTLF